MPRNLVIQLARFGDILQSARLVDSLVHAGETHLCVDHSLTALAQRTYPQVVIHGVHAHGGDPLHTGPMLGENLNTFSALATLAFDAVYNLNHSGMNRAMARLFPFHSVRGYSAHNGQDLRERWMRLAFQWTRQRRIAPLNLMDFWGLLAPEPLAPTLVNPKARPGGKGLGVVLAGRNARRTLPPDVLAPCVHALFETMGGPKVYLLGGKAERPVARQLTRLLPSHMQDAITVLAGRTTLPDLVEAVQGLDMLFSPDTGTMHLAARLGVPVQAVFLSSAWAWETGPYGEGHSVWQAAPPCAPCAETAGCIADLACLAPFRSPAFLNRLAGRFKAGVAIPMPNLVRLTSAFDPLGEIWHSEDDLKQGKDCLGQMGAHLKPNQDCPEQAQACMGYKALQAPRAALRQQVAAHCRVNLSTSSQLGDAQLGDAQLGDTQLGDTQLGDTQLGDTQLGDTQLGDTQLGDAQLDEAHLDEIQLTNTLYTEADWMLPDVHP